MKISLLILSFFFSDAAAAAMDFKVAGNGGGVICIQSRCRTLAESGLRIVPSYSEDGLWLPTPAMIERVERHLSDDPVLARWGDLLLSKTFGNFRHFRLVTVADPRKLRAVENTYRNAVRQANPNLDMSQFKIVAFSSDDTAEEALTYILPDFLTLNLATQAELLIHEGLYRGRPTSDLRFILQFENSHVRAGPETWNDRSLAAFRLGLVNKSELMPLLFSIHSYPHYGTDLKEFSRMGSFDTDNEKFVLDHKKLYSYAKKDPRLPLILSKIKSFDFEKVEPRETPCGSGISRGENFLQVEDLGQGPRLAWIESTSRQVTDERSIRSYTVCRVRSVLKNPDLDLYLPR